MTSGNNSELQQEIVAEWYSNPNATNSEIATACDCSASYVSQVKSKFDTYDKLEAVMAQFDNDIQQMFDEIEDDIEDYFEGVEDDVEDYFEGVESDIDQMFEGV